MDQKSVFVNGIEFNNDKPLAIIAGPCVIESREMIMQTAEELVRITKKLGLGLIFKSSFEKANRSSASSFTGPGIEEGLKILAEVKEKFNIPVITDIHCPEHAEKASKVVDVLQIPAFLSRQSDLAAATAKTGKVVNVKKAQFTAPADMHIILDKYNNDSAEETVMQCERGTCFGHNGLVVDFAGFKAMKASGYPLIMDATHAAQIPGGNGTTSGGKREVVADLAKAAVAIGVAGVFLEIHPDVAVAKCDQPNQFPLQQAEELLTQLKQLDNLIKSQPALDIK